ncbi:hypothetical protein B7R22_10640 [Subtercola boreus]|uniref:Uncharacterized protein n=2 Tax=Subtercola boreus TaxID=120213 RepID=A0A3E0VW23_9MICO|nr:hypothetical protein B7R22_10640 [Subtercola boreus]
MIVLVGLALLAVWLLLLLLIAVLGLPVDDQRRSGGFLLLLLPLAAVALVVVGLVSVIRRKPVTFTSSNAGRHGSLGPKIRAEERRQREERKRLKADWRAAATEASDPER